MTITSIVHPSLLQGNDFVFFTAFLTAFLFNWIGFLLLMCFCHTIAARYGNVYQQSHKISLLD